MTECKRSNANLKRLSRQSVEVDFNGGTLTSDGGLLMLREVDDRYPDADVFQKPRLLAIRSKFAMVRALASRPNKIKSRRVLGSQTR